ncbi:MAG: HlyD family efflux transporter periplasmic adaptor subunit, partial [bacterium]
MKRVLKFLFKFFLGVLILGGGIYVTVWFIRTRPEAGKSIPETKPLLVDVMIAHSSSEQMTIPGNGNVIPSQTVVVQPEVSGRVIKQSPELLPGGRFKSGDIIAQIDPRDYQYSFEQQKAKVEKALFDMKEEEGRQTIAAREWKLLGSDIVTTDTGRDLALRRPHLRYAKASLEAATSALDQARLNLERTTIRAPFNAIVLEKFIDLGQLVSPQTKLAELVGTDEYWVQVSIAVDRLPWIRIPEVNSPEGARAKVIREGGMGGRIERDGRVVRLLGDLSSVGRMA